MNNNNNLNAPLALTQASNVSKEKSDNSIFSMSFNNHIYTSKHNHYTEKDNGINGFFNKEELCCLL